MLTLVQMSLLKSIGYFIVTLPTPSIIVDFRINVTVFSIFLAGIAYSCILICLILSLLRMYFLFILLLPFFSAMVPIARNESPREK